MLFSGQSFAASVHSYYDFLRRPRLTGTAGPACEPRAHAHTQSLPLQSIAARFASKLMLPPQASYTKRFEPKTSDSYYGPGQPRRLSSQPPRLHPRAGIRRLSGASIPLQPEGRLMAEAQQVLVGGNWRLIGKRHDDGSESVAPPLPLPQQPLPDESGDRLATGLADKLEVGRVPGPLLQGGGHATFQLVELLVLVEACPAALGASFHFGGVNRGRLGGANARSSTVQTWSRATSRQGSERRRW